jgi:ABC-type transport system substrate-binding protein
MIRQRGATQSFNYDPAEAHRTLAAAGWNRDASGMYRSADGHAFPIELVAQSDVGTRVQLVLAVTNQWKSAGLDATSSFISGATDWREPAAKANGAYVRRQLFGYVALPAFTTNEIAAESNRWRNSNRGGFSNAAYDQLYARFWTTLGATERNDVAAEMLRILLDQAAYIPFIHNAEVAAVRKDVRGVTGVSPAQQVTAWNVHLWTTGS